MTKRRQEKSKIRADFRKKRESRERKTDFTKDYHSQREQLDDLANRERVSGKGRLTRKRTVLGQLDETGQTGFEVELNVDAAQCLCGQVVRVTGLNSLVKVDDRSYGCTLRGVLKSMQTDLQNVIVAGDNVTIQPTSASEGVVVRVEPRRSTVSRTSRGRQQIIASNVDLALIVTSAAQPDIKPNLIDRMLLTIESAGIQPVIVINKVDLIDLGELQPLVGVWGQLGYPCYFTSAEKQIGIDRLRLLLHGRNSVVTGQSGVGKSSLINAVDAQTFRRIGEISRETEKGRHTTTVAELIPWTFGGNVVDTPGIRQFQLWNVISEEVEGLFRDIRPYSHRCRYPDCTHTHEEDCAVKDAVADGRIDARRYESYCQIRMDL